MTSCSSGIGVQVGPQLLPGDPPVGGRLDRDHPFGRDAVLGAPVGDGLGGQRLAVCLEELAREGGLAADEVAGALDGGGAGDAVGHVRLSGETYSSLLQRSTGNRTVERRVGQGVSVSVDLGGRRNSTTKNIITATRDTYSPILSSHL